MDPFAKKMIRGSFAFAAVMLLMFVALTVIYLHVRPHCSDQVVSSATSPDGHWTATVMEARCGASEPFLTHGNIRVSQTTIEENTTGLFATAGGTIVSFGNNRLAGNGTNGSFTSTIPLS